MATEFKITLDATDKRSVNNKVERRVILTVAGAQTSSRFVSTKTKPSPNWPSSGRGVRD